MNAKKRTIFLIAGVCAAVIAIALTLILTLKQPHVHAYGDPSYAWSTENGEQYCTATKTCSGCKDGATGHEISEKVAAKVTVTQSRTCTLPELADLKAEFTVEGFTSQTKSGEQTKPATGHAFSEALTATADEHYHACENAGCTATEGNAAHSPSQDYIIVTEATCSEKGRKAKVCADCGYEIDPIEIAIDETKHAYGDPIYVWSNDFVTYIAKVVCANDESHEIKEEVYSSRTTYGFPEDGKGVNTYEFEFSNPLFTKQTVYEHFSDYYFAKADDSVNGDVRVSDLSITFRRNKSPQKPQSEHKAYLIDKENSIYSIVLNGHNGRNNIERYLVTLNDSTMKTVAFKTSSLGVAYEEYTFASGHPNESDAKIRVYTKHGHAYADLIAVDTADILETYICKIDKENNLLIADGKYYTIGANNVLSVTPKGKTEAEYSFTYDEDGTNNVTYDFRDNGFMYIKVKPAGKTEYAYVEAYTYTVARENVFVVDEGINNKAYGLYKINNETVVRPIDLVERTEDKTITIDNTQIELKNILDYNSNKEYLFFEAKNDITENIYFVKSGDGTYGYAYLTYTFYEYNGICTDSYFVCAGYWKYENGVITLYDDEKVNTAKQYDRTFRIVNGQVEEIIPNA